MNMSAKTAHQPHNCLPNDSVIVVPKSIASAKCFLTKRCLKLFRHSVKWHYLQWQLKWKIYTKVIKMLSWMAWVQRPSGLIQVEGSASTYRGSNLGYRRECFIESNINNQSRLLSGKTTVTKLLVYSNAVIITTVKSFMVQVQRRSRQKEGEMMSVVVQHTKISSFHNYTLTPLRLASLHLSCPHLTWLDLTFRNGWRKVESVVSSKQGQTLRSYTT